MREESRSSVPQQGASRPEIRFRNEAGNLRKELLTDDAIRYAELFKKPDGDAALTNHQIRRFYNEVKALEAKIEATSFEQNEALVHMLRAKVAYAKNKPAGKVPSVFKDFIDNCVKEINKAGDKEQAFQDFALFFEAVMGFADLRER